MPHDRAPELRSAPRPSTHRSARPPENVEIPPAFLDYRPSAGEHDRMLHHLSRRTPVMLVGPTGCGKTTLVHQAATELQLEVRTIVGHADLTAADLLGRWTLDGDRSVWCDGPLTAAARRGSMLYLDEIEAVPAEILTCLHPLTDHRREVVLTALDQRLAAHPDFVLVASFNPTAGGPRSLSPALRQRFRWIRLGYLDRDAEIDLLCDATGLDPSRAGQLVDAARVTRARSETVADDGVSTRLLLAAAADLAGGAELRTVLEECLLGPLADDHAEHEQILESLAAAGVLEPPAIDHLQVPATAPPHLTDDAFYDGSPAA